jgi:hypothetical protein
MVRRGSGVRSRMRKLAAIAFALLLASLLIVSQSPWRQGLDAERDAAGELSALVEATGLEAGYIWPHADAVARSEALFERLLRDDESAEVRHGLSSIGFDLVSAASGDERLAMVREASEAARGGGVYVFRQRGARPVLLQAPHRFHDIGTGRIVLGLLAVGGIRAAAWNTVPRRHVRDGEMVDSDLAREPVSHFNAFGQAFARQHPRGRVIQIHGFARENRTTASGAAASVIVSSGTEHPSRAVREVAECLSGVLAPEPVLLFPEDVRELGATTNVNGQILRRMGFRGFVHVELARELRDRLLDEPRLLERVGGCLA